MGASFPNGYMPNYNSFGNPNLYNNNYQPSYQSYSTNSSMPTGVQQQSVLKGRPVSSIDEARAAQIDYDGSLFIFPDIAGRKIYTRQVMLNGTPAFNIYTLDESVNAQQTPYVMRDEFENTVGNIQNSLMVLQKYIEGANNEQPKPSSAATTDDVLASF